MKKISVLYVDDEPGLLELTKVYLEQSDRFEVTVLPSAALALKHLKTRSYDAIISDYQMPGINGIEFLKQIRKTNDGIPFILFTGRGREEVVIEALNHGADSYLQKGGDPKAQFAELEHRIRSHVQRKWAQDALSESEKKYRRVVENAHEGIYIIQDERIIFSNPHIIERITECGISEADFLSKPFFTFIHPDDRQLMRDRYYRRIENGESFSRYPFRMVNSSGAVYWWDIYAVVIDWNGRPATLNFARNITEQYSLEERLSDSECRYRELLDLLPKTVIGMDTEFNLTFINRSGEEKWGYANGEILGKLAITDLIAEADRGRIRNALLKATEGERITELETIATLRNGRTFPVKLYLSPMIRKSNIAGFLAVCVDISDFRDARTMLAYTNNKLDLMGKINCHDLHNQLTILDGYLALAEKKTKDQDVLRYLHRIGNATKTIRIQMSFMEQYMKIGSSVPLWQNIEELISNIHPDLLSGTIRIDIDLGGLEIYGDLLLEKVLYNLFDNAIRHGGHVTAIRISFDNTETGIDLVFEDNGIGIPESEKKKIFTCGYGKNTGLGLFVIEQILSISGITIAETGEPGKGARFVMHIPAGSFRFVPIPSIKPG
ncbi:PAS domain S-box protein [Methanoregula formicica]|uniref:histidine kinase n=1 Tax=Methanoregula formicica (strain DSM 22288 / NBRC 105244 / SMSP) TaxID=593750 RepID=L0HDB0_METFS|nr:PAS domain S-box protein [Methanoregula formicica]AGB01089.1 PAS domain S-box [Methanoregula formicica SMSP]